MSEDMPTACRRCSDCQGEDHHWGCYGDMDDGGEPVWSCKHCDATKPMFEDDDVEDDCCPGCGACPGFIGAECDATCEWASTEGKFPHE